MYSYSTNISVSQEHEYKLGDISGTVIITPSLLDKSALEDGFIRASNKILHVKLSMNILTESQQTTELECFTIFDGSGQITQVHLPEDHAYSVTQVNMLKGVLSLLIVHPALEPTVEVDASGECQVLYAQVEPGTQSEQATKNSAVVVVVDKVKFNCSKRNIFLDTWSHNVVPLWTSKGLHNTQLRYHFREEDWFMLEVASFEIQQYPVAIQLKPQEIDIISWNSLKFLKKIETNNDRILSDMKKLAELPPDEVSQPISFDILYSHLRCIQH